MRSHAASKCNDCHKVECDCDENSVLSREEIDHEHKEVVTVSGDYQVDAVDEVVIVFSRPDENGDPTTSTVTLVSPDDLSSADTVTVVAVDGPVKVDGIQNEDRGGSGSLTIAAGGQATFRAIQPSDDCNCEPAFYLACLCPPLLT